MSTQNRRIALAWLENAADYEVSELPRDFELSAARTHALLDIADAIRELAVKPLALPGQARADKLDQILQKLDG